jgi:hypothetical protein
MGNLLIIVGQLMVGVGITYYIGIKIVQAIASGVQKGIEQSKGK